MEEDVGWARAWQYNPPVWFEYYYRTINVEICPVQKVLDRGMLGLFLEIAGQESVFSANQN